MENVRRMIRKFENTGDKDVGSAFSGSQWGKLKQLVDEIDNELGRTTHDVVGRNTTTLVSRALNDLGGKASTKQIYEWIESHPEAVAECPEVKLNCEESRKKKGKKRPAWMSTVDSCLSVHFQKSGEVRGNQTTIIWSVEPVERPIKKKRTPASKD
eukprot:gnl/TRDRNA2_/TRDRNA2_31356_c0_seq1.p1 gnl/TRDRNA2_/TRDRNA2_31356_c0~~gnl/TRDRNA2_/TRDRNA2_31356_c0_seq1.p1  ORF type:complete len:156 (+),score=22.46 gnl/TRDRNA2_/TRDRNA2_31356_c0_seq1:356-823(+)